MTFFLPPTSPDTKIKGRALPTDEPPSFLGGVGASVESSWIEGNRNFDLERRTTEISADKAKDAIGRLGVDAVVEEARRRGLPEPLIAGLPGAYENMRALPPEVMAVVRDMSAQAREESPSEWADVDLSPDGVDRAVNESLRSQLDEAQAILDLTPEGQGAASVLGGMVGTLASVKDAPWLFLGGAPGALWRVASREAMINTAQEGTILPEQFEIADRLDLPKPDIAAQLALAAGAGGFFGTGIELLGRGVRYMRSRSINSQLPAGMRYDEMTGEIMIDEAEMALTSGRVDAMAALAQIPQRYAPEPEFWQINPLNPERPPLIPTPAEAVSDMQPDLTPPPVSTTPLERTDGQPREPLSDANLIETLRNGIDEAEAEARAVEAQGPAAKKPLTHALSRRVNPSSALGQELKARGITSRTNPTLFSNSARDDLDVLIANEWEQEYPGITDAAGMSDDGNYLDPMGVVEILLREQRGDTTWLRSRADAAAIREQAAEVEAMIETGQYATATDSFTTGQRSDSGFYVDLNDYDFDGGGGLDAIARDVTEYLDNTGIRFTDAERAEIVAIAQRDGGDVEFLVERMAEREIDSANADMEAINEIPDEAFPARAPDGGQGPARDGETQGAGDTGQPDGPAGGQGEGAAGRGDAGRDQQAIPGTERVDTGQAQRDRATIAARQQQSRIGRLDQQRVEDDETSLFGSSTRDMFDDVTSPEARTVQDSVATDLRDGIEADGDFDVDVEMPDGTTRTMKASEALDYMDEIEAFSLRVELCGKG